jgi:O-antigen ligase
MKLIGVCLLLFIAAYGVATVLSIDPARSWPDFWRVVLQAGVFIGAYLLRRIGLSGKALLNALTLGSLVPMVLIVLGASGPNAIAGLLNVLLWPNLAFAGAQRWRWLWLAPAAVMIFLSASRGGWVGTAAGGATMFALYRPRIPRWWPWAVGALLLAGLAYQVARGHIGAGYRPEFWGAAWRMLEQSPLVGTGPSTAPMFLGWLAGHQHLHSIPLNLLAETGLLGGSTGGALAAAALRPLVGQRDALSRGALAALAATAAHGMLDTITWDPAITSALGILLAAAY